MAFDVAIIGGGLLGCFAARNIRRWNLSAAIIEQREDVCTGFSRANTAIIYPGYDNKPGSLKAELTVQANTSFDNLCRELDVPFSRCGSLMVSYGKRADKVLLTKYEQGQKNGVPGLRLLSGQEAKRIEPELRDGICSALYAPTTGTVNPWELGIAAFENAVDNGVTPFLNTKVHNIKRMDKKYLIQTNRGEIWAKVILNCAGWNADKIQELLFPPSVRIIVDAADYLVLDRKIRHKPTHIIMHEPEEDGKGLTAVPTVEGNLLLGPSQRAATIPFATTEDGLEFVRKTTAQILPNVERDCVIRSFGAIRPNPYRVKWEHGTYVRDEKNIGSFVIDHPEYGFWSLIGIKTPGLTCSNELGKRIAEQAADYLHAAENPAFSPDRVSIKKAHALSLEERASHIRENPDYGEIICYCEDISKAEIIQAIQRGAVTVDGVKRRIGATMGRCQGSRCQQKIVEILAEELGVSIYEIRKDGGHSYILGGMQDGTI